MKFLTVGLFERVGMLKILFQKFVANLVFRFTLQANNRLLSISLLLLILTFLYTLIFAKEIITRAFILKKKYVRELSSRFYQETLRKIPKFYLISLSKNFREMYSFRRVLGETLRKLCTKLPH